MVLVCKHSRHCDFYCHQPVCPSSTDGLGTVCLNISDWHHCHLLSISFILISQGIKRDAKLITALLNCLNACEINLKQNESII